MVTDEWFVTTGEQHLKQFFGMICRVLATGQAKDLVPHKVDVDDIFRVYRGEPIRLTEAEADKVWTLYKQGVPTNTLVNLYGVPYPTMKEILNRRNKKP